MAQQGSIDVELPGAPAGPSNPFWPTKGDPWRDQPNPWPGDPASTNGGGRIPVPGGKDMDDNAPGAI
jgi:hypothetical protein